MQHRATVALLPGVLLLVACGRISQPSSGPAAAPGSAAPLTNVESLMKQKGVLVVADSRDLGEAGDPGERSTYYRCKVAALVSVVPGLPPRRGLRFEIRGGEHGEHTSFLDESEVSAVSRALGFLIDYSANVKRGDRGVITNVRYTTAGDFTLGLVISQEGETVAWLESGSVTGAEFRMRTSSLPQLKTLVDSGLAWLKERPSSMSDTDLNSARSTLGGA